VNIGLRVLTCVRLRLRPSIETAIREADIVVDGICPECGRVLTEEEIRRGWTNDPYDFTTRCVDCGHRFHAGLIVSGNPDVLSIGHFGYLCPLQVFTGLKDLLAATGRSNLGLKFLMNQRPDLFWNLRRHYGSYRRGQATFRTWLDT